MSIGDNSWLASGFSAGSPSNMHSCQICRESEHKYKCPNCLIKYCSIPCFKKHKEALCSEMDFMVKPRVVPAVRSTCKPKEHEDGEVSDSESDSADTEDKVPLVRLEMLGDSDEILTLLENPHLQQIMKHLNSTNNPEEDINKAMKEPIFVELADACLKVVEPKSPHET